MSFGDRLKKARKAKKLTQAEVAALTNRNFTSVSRWENNHSEPDRETLMKLADLYGVPVNELIGADFTEEEKEVNNKIKNNVPLEIIASEHEMTYKDKVLTQKEKESVLEFVEILMRMRGEKD